MFAGFQVKRGLFGGVALLCCVVGVGAGQASANARHFTYTYESATLPQGAAELEVWTTNKVGRDDYYNRFENRVEYEYGITDRLMTAFYVNTKAVTEGEEDERESEFEFSGVSSEWKYKLSDAVADAVGSALYGEVSYGPDELELEAKLILDKRVASMLYAANLVAEYEIEELGGENEEEYALALELGAAYFITESVSVGLEASTEAGFEHEFERMSVYAGPNVSWSAEKMWASLTVLGQVGTFDEDWNFSRDLEHEERVNARLLLGFHI